MARYEVYDPTGKTVKCTLDRVEYNGTFMNSRVVDASVSSSSPLSFSIGDYITYRGEKFELDHLPSGVKNNSSGNQIDSFKYDLQFVSIKYELERCMMRDIVPNDNGITYPTALSIEFTGTASKLAERIQTCLDLMYSGSKKWTIKVDASVGNEEKNITISQSNCWSALSLFNTEYDLNFYISGRTVTVGGSQLAVDYNFKYGKGNGLYKIERTPDTDTSIVTRLIAYGGTQNIPDNYLKDKKQWTDSILPSSMYLPNLMLPGFQSTKKDYIDSAKTSIYGIREGVIVFEDVYPSLSGMSNSKGDRIDTIKEAESVTSGSQETFWITTYDLEFESALTEYFIVADTPRIYIKTGQLQGYTFEIVQEKVENLGDGSYKIYLRRNSSDGFPFPNEDVNLTAGTEFVFLGISMPKAYMDAASARLLERAKEYLAKYDVTNFSYTINIDELFMHRMPDIYNSLYEGKRLNISDSDLGINESVTIQSLSITEELGSLPSIKVTLNNEVSASTLNRIQGQVSQLESQVASSFTSLKWLTEQKLSKLGKPSALWDSAGTLKWLMLNDTEDMAKIKYTLFSTYDVIANATDEIPEEGLPVAVDYTTTGLFRAKKDGGLMYDANNGWYVSPDYAGGGGIDEAQLKKYLDSNGYVTDTSLGEKSYIKLDTALTGYTIAKQYTALSPSDNILTAFGKLEKHFDDYVTLTTEQTITGTKWFNGIGTLKVGNKQDVYLSLGEGSGNCINGLTSSEAIGNLYFNYVSSTSYTRVDGSNNIVTTGDVVANSTGAAVSGLPIASDYTTTGLFKAKNDGGLLYDANGWYVNPDFAGGGVSFATGKALELTADNILNVLTGTTATTVCAGNDSRLSDKRSNPNKLSWSGYSTGDYDGSEAKSITLPSKVSQLTNDSGYITSINWSMVSNAVYNNTSGLGSGYYLNGDGELKKIAYSDLSGTPDLSGYVTLTTSQTITGSKWFNGTSLLTVGPKTNVHIVFGAGAGNCINGLTSSEAIGNLYFNYVSSTSYTRVDGSNNFVTSGDVVANSTGAAVSGLPVADASTYGLVKYDNSTIKKNSSGQLYCTVSGGSGGSSVSWSGSLSSGTKIGTLTINGTGYTLYAPSSSGGSGGSTVSWSGSLSSGTKIGTLTINGTGYTLYAPSSSGGSSGTASALSTDVILSGRTHFRTSGNTIGIGMSGGNSLFGWNNTSAAVQDMGNLYFNYISNNVCVRVDTNGKIYSNGSQLSSDTRQKTIVGNVSDVLDKMQKIPVIRYYRVNSIDKTEETGFGAQSFLGVFDNVTSVNPDTGYYVINSNAILSIAWQGVNELYAKLKEQQATIDALQAKLDELTKIVTEMKGGNV